MVKKVVLVVVTVAAVAATLVAPSAMATTEPAIVMNVNVTVSDGALTFSKLRARRGWGANFVVTNRGSKPYQFEIGGLKTRVLRPGQKARVSAAFEERGRFPFGVVGTKIATQKGWFVVF